MASARPAVLAVDDNVHNLVALDASLADLDVDVVRASSGASALVLLREREFAAILLDVEMPPIDGFETARRARAFRPHTPILFLTARREVADQDLDRAYALGAVDFLVKPIPPEVLRAKVGVFAALFAANAARRDLEADRAVDTARREWEADRERKARGRLEVIADLTWPDDEGGDEIVADTLRRVARFLGAEASACWSADGDRLVLASADRVEGEVLSALATAGAVRMPRLESMLGAASGAGHRWAVVAVAGSAGLVGALAVRTAGDLDPEDVEFLHGAAARAAAGVDRHRLVEQLERRADELAEQHRWRDEHMAALAHELRNPLAPLLHAAGVIERLEPHPSAVVGRARRIVTRQVRHLARLVDDLVDLTRMTTGEFPVRREALDLRGVVDRALVGAQPSIDERAQDLSFVRPSGPIPVVADRERLVQLLAHLLDNASKFTPQHGHVEVSVSADPEEGSATIVVADDGRGIPAEWLPGLFTAFGQRDRVERLARGGLGLGLALVRRIAELHGGTVSARSGGAGKGTQIEVVLPLAAAAEGAGGEAEVPDAPAVEEGPLRIVVVEDNPDVRDMLVSLLELMGHEVSAAGDGEEGAREILARLPDLAFVDIGLPVQDGYAVARQVRAGTAAGGTRLWALTGFGRPEDRQHALDAGFDGHLVKPATNEQLQAALRTARAPRGA